ncbi:hypothetical protein [Fischerella sp. PCC 9605]|uniref:hypothetical protein n=1 Tax=Fischerella sp. PCC 9605 TaxID=1173024 RepID=UPI0004BACD25|nr:hypothetical protein [Fischerella sp. PCC 9605]
MKIGSLQLVVIGFNNDQNFRGQILAELDAVRGRGAIRLIDLLFVHKNTAGNVTVMTDSEKADLSDYGATLKQLAGLNGSAGAAANMNAATSAYGVTTADVRAVLDQVAPGTAVAIALFEHAWAGGLAEAVRDAGGHLLAQGILTRDAVLMLGEELAASAEAERVIEATLAIKGAALLDAIAFVESAKQAATTAVGENITAAIAAQTLRTLMAVGVVDDSEIEPAILSLVEVGLLSPEIVANAIAKADAALNAVNEAFAAQGSYS